MRSGNNMAFRLKLFQLSFPFHFYSSLTLLYLLRPLPSSSSTFFLHLFQLFTDISLSLLFFVYLLLPLLALTSPLLSLSDIDKLGVENYMYPNRQLSL